MERRCAPRCKKTRRSTTFANTHRTLWNMQNTSRPRWLLLGCQLPSSPLVKPRQFLNTHAIILAPLTSRPTQIQAPARMLPAALAGNNETNCASTFRSTLMYRSEQERDILTTGWAVCCVVPNNALDWCDMNGGLGWWSSSVMLDWVVECVVHGVEVQWLCACGVVGGGWSCGWWCGLWVDWVV